MGSTQSAWVRHMSLSGGHWTETPEMALHAFVQAISMAIDTEQSPLPRLHHL